MSDEARMPALWLPFALVGGAAGWLCTGALSNPLVRSLRAGDPYLAVVVTALVGALVGAFVTKRCSTRRAAWEAPGSAIGALIIAVLGGGATSGFTLGALNWSTGRGAFMGLVAGVACGVAFVPVCAMVLAAARRAERARMGSLVAGSDRRTVWAILLMTLAASTLLALPEWPALADGSKTRPEVAWAIAFSACVVNAAIALAELGTLRRVQAAVAGAAAMVTKDTDDSAEEAQGVARLDLGLGDAVRAEIARAAAAYRDRERTVALLIGDAALARAAITRALACAAVSAALSAGVLWLHMLAASDPLLARYRERRCAMGSGEACARAAAQHQRGEALRSSAARAAQLQDLACWHGVAQSCSELARGLERGQAVPGSSRTTADLYQRACDLGERDSCRAAAHATLRADAPARAIARIVAPLERACRLGDELACVEAAAIRGPWRDESSPLQLVRCLQGWSMECDALARLEHDDDWWRARSLRELACHHGLGSSCDQAARMRLQRVDGHEPLRKQQVRAAVLFERACDHGVADGCCEAAYLYVWSALPHDGPRARALLQRATAAGYADAGACWWLTHQPPPL